VQGNQRKQSVFDLVQIAIARREVKGVEDQNGFLCGASQSDFYKRTRCPLLLPPSAVITNRFAFESA
jgi:hypothetical protein